MNDYSNWTVENLLAMKQGQLKELFLVLPAPSIRELQGEFKGTLLDTGAFRFIKNFLAYFALSSFFVNGKWMGKGFKAISDTEGRGYNSYRRSGAVRHVLPMKTHVAPSRFDGKEVFLLDYTAFRSAANSVNMIDEVRKINDNLYLGIGFWGYTRWQRNIPFFFALSGPPAAYIGADRPHGELRSRLNKLT